ncbi:hypothetical protein ACWGHM_31430 [Streptomyces sp. NPDC054904]
MAAQLNPQLNAKMAGDLDAYKVSCARMVTQAVEERGLNPRAAAIAIATIIVETGMNNYSQAVDHTSLGLFQQQDWWGSREQRLKAGGAVLIANALWSGMGGGPKRPYASGRVVHPDRRGQQRRRPHRGLRNRPRPRAAPGD